MAGGTKRRRKSPGGYVTLHGVASNLMYPVMFLCAADSIRMDRICLGAVSLHSMGCTVHCKVLYGRTFDARMNACMRIRRNTVRNEPSAPSEANLEGAKTVPERNAEIDYYVIHPFGFQSHADTISLSIVCLLDTISHL
jgi:hypothetical protein